MANKITDTQHYQDIADAIRAKNGETTLYQPGDMAQAIEDLPSGADTLSEVIQSTAKSITIDYGNKMSTSSGATIKIQGFNLNNKDLEEIKYKTRVGAQEVANPIATSSYPAGYALKKVDFGNLESTAFALGSLENGSWSNLDTIIADNLKAITSTSFMRGASFTKVRLPKLQTTGTYAFGYCNKLVLADFGNSQISQNVSLHIANATFYSCQLLEALVLRATANIYALTDSYVLYNTPIANGTGYIYVPRALISTYESATNWSTYAGQFRALEDYTDDGTVDGKFIMPTN